MRLFIISLCCALFACNALDQHLALPQTVSQKIERGINAVKQHYSPVASKIGFMSTSAPEYVTIAYYNGSGCIGDRVESFGTLTNICSMTGSTSKMFLTTGSGCAGSTLIYYSDPYCSTISSSYVWDLPTSCLLSDNYYFQFVCEDKIYDYQSIVTEYFETNLDYSPNCTANATSYSSNVVNFCFDYDTYSVAWFCESNSTANYVYYFDDSCSGNSNAISRDLNECSKGYEYGVWSYSIEYTASYCSNNSSDNSSTLATAIPSIVPTPVPSATTPTVTTTKPTAKPSGKPTVNPTTPTIKPTAKPTTKPTVTTTTPVTTKPTIRPTVPTIVSSQRPTVKSTALPSTKPIVRPTAKPSKFSTPTPSTQHKVESNVQSSNTSSGSALVVYIIAIFLFGWSIVLACFGWRVYLGRPQAPADATLQLQYRNANSPQSLNEVQLHQGESDL